MSDATTATATQPSTGAAEVKEANKLVKFVGKFMGMFKGIGYRAKEITGLERPVMEQSAGTVASITVEAGKTSTGNQGVAGWYWPMLLGVILAEAALNYFTLLPAFNYDPVMSIILMAISVILAVACGHWFGESLAQKSYTEGNRADVGFWRSRTGKGFWGSIVVTSGLFIALMGYIAYVRYDYFYDLSRNTGEAIADASISIVLNFVIVGVAILFSWMAHPEQKVERGGLRQRVTHFFAKRQPQAVAKKNEAKHKVEVKNFEQAEKRLKKKQEKAMKKLECYRKKCKKWYDLCEAKARSDSGASEPVRSRLRAAMKKAVSDIKIERESWAHGDEELRKLFTIPGISEAEELDILGESNPAEKRSDDHA